MNPKVDSWRTPKEKAAPRASLGGPTYAKVYDGPDQELSAQLERCAALSSPGIIVLISHDNCVRLWHLPCLLAHAVSVQLTVYGSGALTTSLGHTY